MTHLTGITTYVRVGGVSDSGSQPGLYIATIGKEITNSSHGEGTSFCSQIFYVYHHRNYYYISSGIGQYDILTGDGSVPTDCFHHGQYGGESAHCHVDYYPDKYCPKGWGNNRTFNLF